MWVLYQFFDSTVDILMEYANARTDGARRLYR